MDKTVILLHLVVLHGAAPQGAGMARTTVITINQSERDKDFKSMIRDLKKRQDDDNPYANRSESEIAKMLLAKILPAEHRRFCK